MGSTQSLLRFGSLETETTDKEQLSAYLFRRGFAYQLMLSVFFLLISAFYIPKLENALLLFLFFSIRLVGLFFNGHLQSEQRILGNNRAFANINNVVNIFGLVATFILTYYFQTIGYLFAMAFVPFLALFWLKKTTLKNIQNSKFDTKKIWNYAFHTSGTAFLSDALYALDILILSWLLNESAVAQYKIAILIPANITFLSLTFMQSDFPILAKNYLNQQFLKNYILNYYKIFIPFCMLTFLGVLWGKDFFIHLFFKDKYTESSTVFVLFFGVFLMNILLRNLYGNLLSAIGKMKANTQVSFFALIILVVSSLFLVKKIGVMGMVISQSITLIFSGILLAFHFWNYYKKLK
jgi:O-antigen/teichoic acid export membrane protein